MRILLALAAFFLFTMAYAAVSAAPWVPTKKRDIGRLKDIAKLKAGEIVYELGCGDGRVLIELTKNSGARGIGIEMSALHVLIAKLRAAIGKALVEVRWGNLFKTNLAEADVVYLFLMPEAYKKLRPKFEAELKPGARVVSYVWPIPGWEPKEISKEQGKLDLYLYQR